MALRDLPASKFPLRFQAYSKIYDQLDAAADGFADLGYADLSREMEAARDRLYAAWNAIAEAERNGR